MNVASFNPRESTVSPRLLRRPWCWRKRILIPFITNIDADGVVDFVGENRAAVTKCARRRLCQVCGTALDPIIVFMGGVDAVRQRLYRQAPFHEECARLALQFCKYLRSRIHRQHFAFARDYRYVPATFPMSYGGTMTYAFQAFGQFRVETIEADEHAPADLRPFGF